MISGAIINIAEKDLNLEQRLPLCVDLDGTLVRTNTLVESALALVKLRPLTLFLLPLWLWRGRAYLKAKIARYQALDVSTLPYNRELLQDLIEESQRGRKIYLATGANEVLANQIAEHVGAFRGVIASNENTNAVGRVKSKLLQARFGLGGFDYVGNSRSDVPVWRAAKNSIAVNAPPRLLRGIRPGVTMQRVYPRVRRWSVVMRALRVHQWAKNVLLFVPLLTSHTVLRNAKAESIAFLAFSLAASSIYIFNDLLDLESDRLHSWKRDRPIASGDLSIELASLLALVLVTLCVTTAAMLSKSFQAILLAYWLTSMLYSLRLKLVLVLDIIILAGLYTIRILAGGAAVHVPISPWTLAFSAFLFLSLALVKRVSELGALKTSTSISRRSYQVVDLPQLASLGGAAGYLSVLVFALYINSPDVQKLYAKPDLLWLMCPPLLYWISRIWMLANRQEIQGDPVLFALKDKPSYLVGAICLLVGLTAL
jgi:4-hydroxybenzoate polyprenyltransferase/phosphoserine phosphatase